MSETPPKWADLNPRQREQISLMLLTLQEFSYGFERADSIADDVAPGSAMFRFYMNALYQYCANFFLVGGAHKLSDLLGDLGSGDLLEPIERILEKSLGQTTFGEILGMFRNKFIVHPSFNVASFKKEVQEKFDLWDEENAKVFQKLVNDMYAQTQILYVKIAERFPDAVTGE